MATIAFATLGCRVNQYDTDSMRGLFLAEGFADADFNDAADVYVINTCSVTQMGEKKSRQLIRRAKKRNPKAVVVVTGCYAQLDPELLAAMEGVDAVVGTNEKKNITVIVRKLLGHEAGGTIQAVHDVMKGDEFEEIPLYPSAVEHTRADLKIQEGCNNFCTYCIIPLHAGGLKSRQPDAVIAEAQRLISYGFKRARPDGHSLGRIRQGPAGTADAGSHPAASPGRDGRAAHPHGFRRIAGSRRRPHRGHEFVGPHLPAPASAPAVRLRRHLEGYEPPVHEGRVQELLAELRSRIHGLTISTDLILGFPGETDELFQETMETLEELKFSHIHAFPYSQRPGTPAAAMPHQVDPQIKKRARRNRQRLVGPAEGRALAQMSRQNRPCPHRAAGRYEWRRLFGKLRTGLRGSA